MAFLADCRARQAFDLLANTWNPVVLHALRHGPRRPAELRRAIGGIRSKVLTETVRRLAAAGLVVRRELRDRVEYELTDLGRSLLEPLDALGRWAHERGDEITLDGVPGDHGSEVDERPSAPAVRSVLGVRSAPPAVDAASRRS